MANTKKLTPILYGKLKNIVYFTLFSDGTQETNTVIYSSSGTHTALGDADSKACCINQVSYITNSAAGKIVLNWDATTPIVALSLPSSHMYSERFDEYYIPLPNQAIGAAGVTGNITLTTTGLVAGDSLTLILDVRPYA